MFKHSLNMELLRNVARWGNGAGVLLPREWMGTRVKIILIDRTSDIKKEALSILEPYLEDILGIYLIGSYARNEQEQGSDIDIIAISKKTKKEITSGKYSISLITLESAEKTLEKNPILILPRLNEAKAILNSSLLEELRNKTVSRSSFKDFIEECKRIIKINKGFITLDKKHGAEYIDSPEIIYSLVLRLRGIFLIKNMLEKKAYSKKEFLKWADKEINKDETEKIYNIYKAIRDNKKIKARAKVETAEKLLGFLEKEAKKLE